MLDLMFEVLAFDYSYYVDLGGIRSGLRAVLHTSNPNIVSNNKKWSKGAQSQLVQQNRVLDRMGS